jgi:hypothetical protein
MGRTDRDTGRLWTEGMADRPAAREAGRLTDRLAAREAGRQADEQAGS